MTDDDGDPVRSDPDWDDPPPRRFRCLGWAAYSGHCGSPDCETCYPGREDPEEPNHVAQEEA